MTGILNRPESCTRVKFLATEMELSSYIIVLILKMGDWMVHGLGGTAMGKCLYEPIIRKVENMDFRNGNKWGEWEINIGEVIEGSYELWEKNGEVVFDWLADEYD